MSASAAAAQSPTRLPSAQEAQQIVARGGGFSAEVEMIRVPVVVEDETGAFIENLRQGNFVVQDGGKRHPVAHFVSDAEPATIGIIVDASALMATHEHEVRAAVMRAVNNLRLDDELFLIAYGATPEVLAPLSTDRFAFAMAMAGYTPKGADRALFDAIELGVTTLDSATHDKRSLIVVGAGADTSSRLGEITLQQVLRRAGVSVHAIVLADRPRGPRNGAARVNRAQTLPEIVRFTGGLAAQKPPNPDRFGGLGSWLLAAGHDISTYVKHQYLLHYAPQNPPRPGSWRTIRVLLDVDYERVRARSGYMR